MTTNPETPPDLATWAPDDYIKAETLMVGLAHAEADSSQLNGVSVALDAAPPPLLQALGFTRHNRVALTLTVDQVDEVIRQLKECAMVVRVAQAAGEA